MCVVAGADGGGDYDFVAPGLCVGVELRSRPTLLRLRVVSTSLESSALYQGPAHMQPIFVVAPSRWRPEHGKKLNIHRQSVRQRGSSGSMRAPVSVLPQER